MDNDDRPVGRILTRREVLALFGLAGTAALAACAPAAATQSPSTTAANATAAQATEAATQAPATQAATETPAVSFEAATSTAIAAEPTLAATPTTEVVAGSATLPSCVVSPAMTEGPYFVDEKLNRSDIRVNTADGKVSEGTEFTLTMRILQAGSDGCTPMQGALVDIWHCNAQGVYSDVTDRSFSTVGQNFLRGQQATDANGQVTFTTIYPGWYPGRATHIHFKVRSAATATQTYEFTSQMFFDDAFSDKVFANAPYAKSGQRTLNSQDGIFQGGGNAMLLDVQDAGGKFTSSFDIGMQL